MLQARLQLVGVLLAINAPAVFFMGVPSANLADGYVVLRFGSSGDAGPENLQTSRTLAEDGGD